MGWRNSMTELRVEENHQGDIDIKVNESSNEESWEPILKFEERSHAINFACRILAVCGVNVEYKTNDAA